MNPGTSSADWVRLVQLSAWTLVLVVSVFVLTMSNDQALDATRAMASTSSVSTAVRLGVAVVAALGSAVIIWLTLRQLQLQADRSSWLDQSTRGGRFNRLLPRYLACFPLWTVACQYGWLACEVWPAARSPSFINPAWLLRVGVCMSLAVAAWLLFRGVAARVVSRNDSEARRAMVSAARLTACLAVLVPTAAGMVGVSALPSAYAITLGGHAIMAWVCAFGLLLFAERRRAVEGRSGRAVRGGHTGPGRPLIWSIREDRQLVFGLVIASFAVLIVLSVSPGLGSVVGPLAVLFLGLGVWCGIGNAVILLGTQFSLRRLRFLRGVPLWGAFITIALVANIGFSFGANTARTLPSTGPVQPPALLVPEDGEGPVLLVIAEGGGIYAAYHTAMLLAVLEDRARDSGGSFAERITAASGVSGGSVGLGVFAAAVGAGSGSVATRVDRVLSHDFLSPTLAAMLGRNVLPIPHASLDRSRALEDALVAAWRDEVGAQHADDLWQPLPVLAERAGFGLMFNTTRAEDGRQYHLSSFGLGVEGERFHPRIRLGCEGDRFIPLVTAVFLSARFPLVTSSGAVSVLTDKGLEHGHFIDGGYHENYGAAGALAIINDLKARGYGDRTIKVLAISSEQDRSRGSILRGDLIRPLMGLLAVRNAHSERLRQELESVVGPTNYRPVRLPLVTSRGVRVPLGWVLSDRTREHIRAHAEQEELIESLLDWLGAE